MSDWDELARRQRASPRPAEPPEEELEELVDYTSTTWMNQLAAAALEVARSTPAELALITTMGILVSLVSFDLRNYSSGPLSTSLIVPASLLLTVALFAAAALRRLELISKGARVGVVACCAILFAAIFGASLWVRLQRARFCLAGRARRSAPRRWMALALLPVADRVTLRRAGAGVS